MFGDIFTVHCSDHRTRTSTEAKRRVLFNVETGDAYSSGWALKVLQRLTFCNYKFDVILTVHRR